MNDLDRILLSGEWSKVTINDNGNWHASFLQCRNWIHENYPGLIPHDFEPSKVEACDYTTVFGTSTIIYYFKKPSIAAHFKLVWGGQ